MTEPFNEGNKRLQRAAFFDIPALVFTAGALGYFGGPIGLLGGGVIAMLRARQVSAGYIVAISHVMLIATTATMPPFSSLMMFEIGQIWFLTNSIGRINKFESLRLISCFIILTGILPPIIRTIESSSKGFWRFTLISVTIIILISYITHRLEKSHLHEKGLL